MTLRTLNYGNYGIFLIMGNAGFCPSAVLGSLGRSFGGALFGHPLRVYLGPIWVIIVGSPKGNPTWRIRALNK